MPRPAWHLYAVHIGYIGSMQPLPLGIQSFSTIREEGWLYVDKTQHLYDLVTTGKYYFLSRPRRFGKSLMVSTLSALFSGQKELFQGLWVYPHWQWQQAYPVITFYFNSADYKIMGLEAFLRQELQRQAQRFNIELTAQQYPGMLQQLIEGVYQRAGKVVLLVDEYDKPIIDFLDDLPTAEQNREVLKRFYSVLKPLDYNLKFVLLTGVSKFSRVSIFSELNNLTDISSSARYAPMLGYTQAEVEANFDVWLSQLAPQHGGREALLTQIKHWYNGYNWGGEEGLYNPYSVMSFFKLGQYDNFWFTAGTPTFLVKALRQRNQFNLDGIEADRTVFESFELDNISVEALLYQTGYITVKDVNEFGLHRLGYPNHEVRESMLRHLGPGNQNP